VSVYVHTLIKEKDGSGTAWRLYEPMPELYSDKQKKEAAFAKCRKYEENVS